VDGGFGVSDKAGGYITRRLRSGAVAAVRATSSTAKNTDSSGSR
jgi:hypothetical protein